MAKSAIAAAITSRQNPKFKTWLSLLDAKGIKKTSQALVSGPKLVSEILTQSPQLAVELLIGPKQMLPPGADKLTVWRLRAGLFAGLDIFGARQALLVVQAPRPPSWTSSESAKGLQLILALSD